MTAVSFLLQEVANPNTGEQSKRLAVKFNNGKVIRLYNGDTTIDDTIKAIKADKAEHIKRVVVRDGEFGEYCVFTKAVTIEEI